MGAVPAGSSAITEEGAKFDTVNTVATIRTRLRSLKSLIVYSFPRGKTCRVSHLFQAETPFETKYEAKQHNG